ncbi:MAG: helical backbone metal receptor [Phycisphaerae bacterium]|nr:helical backbone metal receptor [Phycisphaerae bacterium]
MKKYYILLLVIFLCLCVYIIDSLISQKPQQSYAEHNAIPRRVISISPATTEVIFELGCQEKLIAISDFCNYPAQTEQIMKIGGSINPNFERISFLEPDLIIVHGRCDDIIDFCNKKHIEFISVNFKSIDGIYEDITQLGAKLGCPDAAEKLCGRIRGDLEDIKNKLSSAKRKKVFFSLYRTPGSLAGITTAGPKTFLTELINIAGGTNIFNDVQQDYPVISKEALVKRQPDIIIETYSYSAGKKDIPASEDFKELGKLNAVINNNIYTVNADLLLKPGPRISQAALALAKVIHPEIFDEELSAEN